MRVGSCIDSRTYLMMSQEQLSVIDITAFADLLNFVIEGGNLTLDLMPEASAAYFVAIDWAAAANPTVAATEQIGIASATSFAAAAEVAGTSVLELATNWVQFVAFVGVEPQAGVACAKIADYFACLSYLTGFQSIAAAVAVNLKYQFEDPTVADAYMKDCFVEPLNAAAAVAAAGLKYYWAGQAISVAECPQCCFAVRLIDSAVYLQHLSVAPLRAAAAVAAIAVAGAAAVAVDAAAASLFVVSWVFVVDEYQHWQPVVAVAAV